MDDFRSIRQQHPKFKQFKHENHNATQEERRTLTLENQKVSVYFSVYNNFLILRPKKSLVLLIKQQRESESRYGEISS